LTCGSTTNIITAIVYPIVQSEVNDINKQRFLAELSKLLTFMYEEDRQEALAMYSEMFDNASDEQALMHILVSPTRQAVVVARSYNAKESRLQVHAQTRSEDEVSEAAERPEFVNVIDGIRQEALAANIIVEQAAEPIDQISLFEEIENEAVPVEEEPAEAQEQPDEVESFLAEFALDADAGFSIEAEEPAAEAEVEEVEEPAEEDEAELENPAEETEIPEQQLMAEFEEAEEPEEAVEETQRTVRKARVGWLILYIIFAIPVAAIGIALLTIPTVLFLLLAAVTIVAGLAVLTSAFGGFPVIADVLLVVGASIVVLALGLLFLWTFVWFIGGAMVGLVRGIVRLGRKWCFKEVQV